MTVRNAVLLITLLCSITAGSIYLFAYRAYDHKRPVVEERSPQGKLSPSKEPDGTYFVRIQTITTAGNEASITFSHVTYFDGANASSSAQHDVDCPKDRPLEACVPTLTKGYYVRESGAPPFTVPVTHSSHISIQENKEVTIAQLQQLDRQFDPVFELIVKDGLVVALTEHSPQ